jgi:short-subunit dehydrogenase
MGKAAISVCLQGLRQRLHTAGVSVVTIKPACVDTPMTAYLPSYLRFVSARAAGRRIYKAMCRGEDIVYIPWFWRWMMLSIQSVPEGLFKRLDLEHRVLQQFRLEGGDERDDDGDEDVDGCRVAAQGQVARRVG